MKRHVPMPRRKAPMKKGRGGLKPINIERAKRRRDKYAAHLKSAHFRWVKTQVRERSGGVCERMRLVGVDYRARCTRRAEVFNHTSYSKVPNEPPEHVEHLCTPCNSEYESARPWRASRRRVLTTRGERT